MAATALDYRFGSISLGPLTPDSRFWGGMNSTGFVDTPLYHLMVWAEENPESGSLFMLDEMDNGNGGNLATLNSAMANGWVTFPNGRTVRFGSNMVFCAAANTYGTGPTAEFAGRNRLDAATLDRFAYLPWDTDQGLETVLVKQRLFGAQEADATAWLDLWRTTRQNVDTFGLKIFVTMRGAINGAKMIAGGIDHEQAWDLVLGNKLPSDQRAKVCPF
jgi:cobaltochelatase CobS